MHSPHGLPHLCEKPTETVQTRSSNVIFERGHVVKPIWITLGALFYFDIFCSCISFFLTFWLIRHIGTIRTANGDFIIPGVTLILSFFILGEDLSLAKIGGLVLVILGVILVET